MIIAAFGLGNVLMGNSLQSIWQFIERLCFGNGVRNKSGNRLEVYLFFLLWV